MVLKMGSLVLILLLLLTGHPNTGDASTSASVASTSFNSLFRQPKPQQMPPIEVGGENEANVAVTAAADLGYVHILTDNGQVMEIESEILDDSTLLHRLVAKSPVGNFGSTASLTSSFFPHIYSSNKNLYSPSTRSTTKLIGRAQRLMVKRGSDTHFCGDMLVNALALVCTGRPAKRSRASNKVELSRE